MILKAVKLPIRSGRFLVVVNELDAAELGVMEGDRLRVKHGRRQLVATAQLTKEIVAAGSIGLTDIVTSELRAEDGAEVEVFPTSKPRSVEFIRKKMRGYKLGEEEIRSIIFDITSNMLSEVEIVTFVISSMLRGMDLEEVEAMTRAMVESGERIQFERGIVVDKHSIGGVPGNKISLIIVPTVAAAGLMIPKTASRAITSASGTADTMEVLANVNLSVDEIKEITERVGGVIAWGGATNIAPADDKIIRVEYPLSIDPRPQLLASVMAKKSAVGAKFVAMDIPVGEGAKIEDISVARSLANDFIELGRRLGIELAAAITYGGQPVGRTIGPALEAREALRTMEERRGPSSLVEKALGIAALLFEMTGLAANGYELARRIFESGKTHEKFMEIVEAQGGERVKADEVAVGDKTFTLTSTSEGAVVAVSNKALVKIARAAGAPKDKGAGVYVHRKRGEVVRVGDPLITIYAEKEWKLDRAIEVARSESPIIVSGMVLEVVKRGVRYGGA
ncbi:MAG: AMP phosphorylase [Archaeoglobaceae archaeon]